ncbi:MULTISPECIES: hypothetical protein [Pectobacterium]|uniref:hypothetical protein n=1 Tax=Pectobacterium TaxID=122277 RepID=UPI001887D015|nr:MULTISPECIES: hypothetical protein [Pectobacterium]UUE46302.1 hypothetical protein L0Y28_06605 [Pectobacterium aroidearum]UUE50523.1 hypothetical protein L0Y23_06615 [Pectobacterium aroidearum]UUE54728.1 hypothetical protein L0Y30_06615 [Pectobacterium aroidearum]UUE63136.1 hypothetical protein L0Y29_06605 [Pectobacterium aroidearum]UUE67361.1 hypothetical protein L0Y22_06605 [Pectobacterium aroidearum]
MYEVSFYDDSSLATSGNDEAKKSVRAIKALMRVCSSDPAKIRCILQNIRLPSNKSTPPQNNADQIAVIIENDRYSLQ